MADEYKKTDKEAKLEQALERFQTGSEYWEDIYRRGEEDNDFAYGNQWDDAARKDRVSQRRPCLTENRLLPFIHQVVNDIRQQRPKIRPIPVDSEADIETAEIYQGIIRNIEMQSDAETAYDTAAKNAVESSVGWIRINTKYVDDFSFDQELCIDRIVNPFAVVMDPNHKRLDGSDAEWCFIVDDIPTKDFESMYPDVDVDGFPEHLSGWKSEDGVRVVEYYHKEYETKTLVKGSTGTYYKEDLPKGEQIIMEREVEIPVIKYCKMTASDILEEQDILGKYIPIVPVVGEEVFRKGKREFYSLIHQAKDPQFMLNVWKSASTEIIGLQPKAPFIGAKGQFKTYASHWANANVKSYPFLEYDPVEMNGQILPPPQRQQPPMSSGSMMQEAMASAEAIKSCLGMYDASAGEQTNDISGKAIIARQMKGDNGTFHFVDNLITAMKHAGRIMVDLIPQIYDNARIVKIIGEDGTEKTVPINQPITKDGKGFAPAQPGDEPYRAFMMSSGKYDVDIDVGPSYATKRQEQANAIIEISRANPKVLEVAGDLLVKSLDIPMAQEIAERIQSQMDPILLGDDPEAMRMQQMSEALQQLQKKLSETEAALQVKQDNQKFDNDIKLAELQLDREKLQMEAAKNASEVRQKQMETEAEAFKDYANGAKDLQLQVDDVREAVNDILSHFEGMATGEPTPPETNQGEQL